MKSNLLTLLFLISVNIAFAQNGNSSLNNTLLQSGVGLGSVIAVVASWSRNQSILWAIIHGVFGWVYVIYFVLTREDND